MPIKKLSYSGGINPDTSLGTLPSNQLVSAQNVILTGSSLTNRSGPFKLVTVNGTGGSNEYVTSVFYWNDQTNFKEWFIMGARDTGNNPQLYQMINDNATSSSTVITTSGVVNEYAQYDVLNGILCIAANVLPLKWTGSGNVAALGASWTSLNVTMNCVKTVNNFVFFGSGSYVYWSNVGDPTTYTAGNFVPFRLLDGDTISALSYIGTNLIIFKHFSIASLSTQTQVITGAVTLGPLTSINVGIGCAGNNCVDRLPDGRLVFLGSNAHLYIFDGNVPVDVSLQSYPGSSIQSLMTSAASYAASFGGGAFVKVYPSRHEVWVILFPTVGNIYFIYDYLNNIWFEKPSTGSANAILCMAYGSSNHSSNGFGFYALKGSGVTGAYDATNALITGDSFGNVWIEDCGIRVDQSGSNPTTQLEFSIPVQADERENINRFFVIPFQTGSSSQTITYFVGKNGTYGSSQTFTSTGGWDRLKIALPMSDPMTSQQIKITYPTAATIQFDPAYISEEADQ